MKEQKKKSQVAIRLFKLIQLILYITFVIMSIYHHGITNITNLIGELVIYYLVYSGILVVEKSIKWQEVKSLFMEE